MALIIENFIKKHPADWLWFQHLFWTEPAKVELLKEMKVEDIQTIFNGLTYPKETVQDSIDIVSIEREHVND